MGLRTLLCLKYSLLFQNQVFPLSSPLVIQLSAPSPVASQVYMLLFCHTY